jgi:hypothetical protein
LINAAGQEAGGVFRGCGGQKVPLFSNLPGANEISALSW